MRTGSRIPVTAVLAAAVLLMAATVAFAVPRASAAAPAIDWKPCPAPSARTLQCAQVEVPMDWRDPSGKKISFGVNRLPATARAERIGTLVFNPGGPGGSGTQWVATEAAKGGMFGKDVRSRYDLVGFDPRGVASSRPAVRCDNEIWNSPRVSLFPTSAEQYEQMADKYERLGRSCLELTGPAVRFMDTVSVARDLEALRNAVGEGKLNYLGLSYGTEIGQQYSQLYPENVRRMVLDGALVHSLEASSFNENESVAYEATLGRFAQWCARSTDCALKGRDVLAAFSELVRKADAEPIPAAVCAKSAACRTSVTGEDIRFAAQGYLLFPSGLPQMGYPGWRELGDALKSAEQGDASAFSPRIIEQQTDAAFSGLAVGCLDNRADFKGYPALKAQIALGKVVSPHVQGAGQSYQYIAQCTDWPTAFTNPPKPAAPNQTRALIVNALYDPSTAYAWAQLMATQMPNSVLLTRDGAGHTSYTHAGPTRDAIDRYLLSGVLPAPGTFIK
ncbi:hypothetical protein C6N75_14040 [Streptomyces solincola]|uniref:Uncharacterized protein n=1 Tax=Streptomyces solincola TaxID=2100817 RepID=A0A2S9PW14_9ACTN|nr:alpha/beta hydrolase [Streptomyces solincola]PRH78598.1 hypothetical protein C6N75_14040 [Streptomyces solincola]